MTLIDERASKDGWDGARLKPLIAALAEVMPWVRQWHSEVDAEFGTSPAQAYDTYLDDQMLTYGFSEDDPARLETAAEWPRSAARWPPHARTRLPT